jgi:peptidoglycan LD-endopeptidase LytH
MDSQAVLSPARQTLRTFAAGAGCGFVAGALFISVLVWQFGSGPGTRAASARRVAALERSVPAPVDDGGAGVLEPSGREAPVATTGSSAEVARPAPSPDAVLAAPAAEALGRRSLLVPVEGVRPEALVRSFGESRGGRLHEAIDILAPRNTPVKAIEGGRIARLFYSKAGGITVYQFDPSEQYCYYYAHLERYADGLAEGQQVRPGQVIGYVGVSGNAPKDTPHLHFAIFRLTDAKRWWEGTPIDPYDVLR